MQDGRARQRWDPETIELMRQAQEDARLEAEAVFQAQQEERRRHHEEFLADLRGKESMLRLKETRLTFRAERVRDNSTGAIINTPSAI